MESDVRLEACRLYFLPVKNRVPLRFGHETMHEVTCVRVGVRVRGRSGGAAWGWGETPLNVGWVWPSALTHADRDGTMRTFCLRLAAEVAAFSEWGHAMELGHLFVKNTLPRLWKNFNAERDAASRMPWLAALASFSAFDIAVHDAFATLNGVFVYETYTRRYMNHDLGWYYDDEEKAGFSGLYPVNFFQPMARKLPAWHLVGGGDALAAAELRGDEPDDDYPMLLEDWIRRDGLTCLKVKLSGADADADRDRLVRVGAVAVENGVVHLCADFNCTVDHPAYVVDILDRLAKDYPALYAMILYLEQPFPYDLHRHRFDVHAISAKKPLFMDESAHDWQHVRLGNTLGWTGVALKTCKTQTGALLSLCWAKAHGMSVMVQDLTNPMIAQVPHLLLAAHAGTLMGVETNAMQFYPEASAPEREIHPGLYSRKGGSVVLDSVGKTGFGYRLDEIQRTLPEPETIVDFGE